MKHSRTIMLSRPAWIGSILAAFSLTAGAHVAAATFAFTGTVETCTPTCDSYAFLGVGSTLEGFIQMDDDAIADGTWVGGDVTDLSFTIGDPSVPPHGPSSPPDPTVDNPFTLDRSADGGGIVVANGQEICTPTDPTPPCWGPPLVIVSSGTTDGATLDTGNMDLWLTTTVLADNGAIISIDFAAGTFTITFGQKTEVVATGTISAVVQDTDGDGLADDADNCILVANADQRDADLDGIGSVCDPDFNNDCMVNFLDLGVMKTEFFGNDPIVDLTGDGVVNFLDLGIMRTGFFQPPGPSGVPNVCSP